MWMRLQHDGGVVSFPAVKQSLGELLLSAPEVRVPEWQSLDVKDKPQGVTHELMNVVFSSPIPESEADAIIDVQPNIPWAEEHFQERVSGIPYNPPPSAANWPFTQGAHKDVTKEGKFSHTYPERFWPQPAWERENGKYAYGPVFGIRFDAGSLQDVVNQLRNSPLTRQAYLPVWFPEDTGAVHGERVPCTLGYHFLIRENKLNVTYFIRSVDFLRHFPDDVYMAMRLGQWMRDQLGSDVVTGEGPYKMGTLTMHIVSLHVFGGDMPKMRRDYGTD